jgi:hypothetical protein
MDFLSTLESQPLLPIAYSSKQVSNLLIGIQLLNEKKGGIESENKVAPIKIELKRLLSNPMEALQQLTSFPQLGEGSEGPEGGIPSRSLLERRSKNEEEDFFLLRTKFASKAKQKFPQLSDLTALTLGEAFAKKVRYSVTYSSQIEDVISQVIDSIRSTS